MARGTPVVSTTKGVEGLHLTAGSHCLVSDDPVGLAQCIMSLLGDADLARRVRLNALELVRNNYDWRALSARFVDLMEGVVTT
jgi:glycosyltransferase involved in cell wall biosynthesis